MQKKLTLKDWLIATRPWSFTASALTVLTVLTYLHWLGHEVNWTMGITAVVAIILFHAAGNTWSDYYDYRSGVDTVEGAISVPTLREGIFTPCQIRSLSIGLLIPAMALGIWMLVETGLPLLYIGLGGVVCTLGYPFFKHRALGDLTILMAYGFLPAIGTSFVATGMVDWRVLWVALPVALIVDSILHANNTRDMESDRRAKAFTMAQGMGLRASAALYVFEVLFPFVWVVVLIPFGIFPYTSLILIVIMRVAMQNSRLMREFKDTGEIEKIAMLDQRSAQLQLLFCLTTIATLLIDSLLLR